MVHEYKIALTEQDLFLQQILIIFSSNKYECYITLWKIMFIIDMFKHISKTFISLTAKISELTTM